MFGASAHYPTAIFGFLPFFPVGLPDAPVVAPDTPNVSQASGVATISVDPTGQFPYIEFEIRQV